MRAFPSLKANKVQNLFHKKDVISVLKILTRNGKTVRVFCSRKTPLFFQFDLHDETLYPTLFTLWQHPDLLYNFTVDSEIIHNLKDEVDSTDELSTLHLYVQHPEGTMVSLSTEDNKVSNVKMDKNKQGIINLHYELNQKLLNTNYK